MKGNEVNICWVPATESYPVSKPENGHSDKFIEVNIINEGEVKCAIFFWNDGQPVFSSKDHFFTYHPSHWSLLPSIPEHLLKVA